jgi:hypothetical protein
MHKTYTHGIVWHNNWSEKKKKTKNIDAKTQQHEL